MSHGYRGSTRLEAERSIPIGTTTHGGVGFHFHISEHLARSLAISMESRTSLHPFPAISWTGYSMLSKPDSDVIVLLTDFEPAEPKPIASPEKKPTVETNPSRTWQDHVGSHFIDLAFAIGDTVGIDGDEVMSGVVTGIGIYAHAIMYQISWIDAATSNQAWFDAFRLKRRDPKKPY